MKLPNEQSGFSHVVLVALILLVVGGVGFAGYKVYEAKNKKPLQADSSTTQSSQNKTEEPTVPEGFKEYKNEKYGFSFVYPEDWKVKTEDESAYLLWLSITSPDYATIPNPDNPPKYISEGGEFSVTLTEANASEFMIDESTVTYSHKGETYSLGYFSYQRSLKVEGSNAVRGTCGHYDPGICTYILHGNKLFGFSYSQGEKERTKTTPEDKYLSEYDKLTESIKFF